ncbi:MAG: hypothetical protein NVSMB29_00960 [Candidatus Dormibacteria bacterium]
MRFMSGDTEVPVLVRLSRNLLLTEAGLLLLGALYLLLARSMSGGTGTVVGGPGIGTLGVVYLALALVIVVIGINVGRLVAWARFAALLLEVVLLAYLVSEAVQRRGSSIVGFLLAIVIIGLLLSPQASRAFALAAAERAHPVAVSGPPVVPTTAEPQSGSAAERPAGGPPPFDGPGRAPVPSDDSEIGAGAGGPGGSL